MTGLSLACPVTSPQKGCPFEVSLPPGSSIRGSILAGRIRSVDWSARRLDIVEAADPAVVVEVCWKVSAILGLNGT